MKSGTWSVVIAAVIERLPAPEQFMAKCGRVLKPGGVLVITTPDPRMEKIATAIGLLKEEGREHSSGESPSTYKLSSFFLACK